MSRRKGRKPRKPRQGSRQRGRSEPRRLEVTVEELEAILERARSSELTERDHEILKSAIDTLAWLTDELAKKNASLKRLRQLFGLSTSEKARDVLGQEGSQEDDATSDDKDEKSGGEKDGDEKVDDEKVGDEKVDDEKNKPKGHGRNGADAYEGAETIFTPHPSLKPGDLCPECDQGKVYRLPKPSTIVRVSAGPPLQATRYDQEGFRCNLCGKVFWAEPPEGVAEKKKYDEAAASMVALLKYGSGLPFNRLQRLQGRLGIPLPRSTQWEIVAELVAIVLPLWEELIRQAAQGRILHNDDTAMKILEHIKENKLLDASKDRTGTWTTCIVSVNGDRRIMLFFTGRQHAGENLADVLERRAEELSAPLQMSDGLDRNLPKGHETVSANCLVHGRRKFVEIVESFPQECRCVIELLAEVYKNDDGTDGMSPEERLAYHQAHSTSPMNKLEQWMKKQIEEKRVEPNSSLGQAISYMLKRWDKLTMFLRVPGAALDNNVVERALKMSILHRKNALFYKTENGARAGDVFMSLIHTAEQCGANPFEYLIKVQKHQDEVRCSPQDWMPWNYQETLATLAESESVSPLPDHP